jgi:putative Mg2+ transporter-C (MgtC) family protein
MPPFIVRLFVQSWYHLFPAPWPHILVILVAVACGGIVGGERARREKPAGLRTLMLVCLGSALFTMTGLAFTSSTGDSGRVAAQIVAGIGFLGAGVILHGRGTISGTTTAATIWVTAAIGMTAATGYAGAAFGVSILVRGILVAVRIFEVRHLGGYSALKVAIEFAPDHGKTRVRIERILADYRADAIRQEWGTVDSDRMRLGLQLWLPQLYLREMLAEIAELPQVLSIEQGAA